MTNLSSKKLNIKRKKLISWVLLIAWMTVIFVYSNQPGDVSDEKSKFVIYIFNVLGLNLNSYFGEMADFIVRKAAHMTEYFILFMLAYNVLKYDFNGRKKYVIALMVSFLYACSDEFHQLFIPGRAGMFKDVLIDITGAFLALIVRAGFGTFKKK